MCPMARAFRCVSLAALAASLSTVARASQPQQDSLPARQILERMAKTYAGCKSYRDSGFVRTVYSDALGSRTEERPFTTAFVRPDRFRFEYSETQFGVTMQYVVWRKGKEVRTWWDLRPFAGKLGSLNLALAGATGVSGGSAHTVPALLLPNEVGGRRLTEIVESRRIDNARLDDVECLRIQGKYVRSPVTLWIDAQTFLLRRIDEEGKFETFSTEETTTYDPVIDGEVPDKMLEFNPPKWRLVHVAFLALSLIGLAFMHPIAAFLTVFAISLVVLVFIVSSRGKAQT